MNSLLAATGHAALVIVVALALGFRPGGDALGWLGAAGLLALLTIAMTWLGVAVGLASPTAEGTGPFTLVAQLLPFLSSAFVPPEAMSGASFERLSRTTHARWPSSWFAATAASSASAAVVAAWSTVAIER